MANPRILLVDDDEIIRLTLSTLLNRFGFVVTTAGSVAEALRLIHSDSFEVLISDLHMPGAGDGLTVVSAMRHANPRAVTMLLSAFPEMTAATEAILLQADEILVKPMDTIALVQVIRERLALGPKTVRVVESVASIVERSAQSIIQEWLHRLQGNKGLMLIPLSHEARTAHLPQLLRDLIVRLNAGEMITTHHFHSRHAFHHGKQRRRQGYSAAMLVEESRILQVSIFHVLQNNLATIDFSILLPGVMTIADEVDCQLSQSMEGFVENAVVSVLTA